MSIKTCFFVVVLLGGVSAATAQTGKPAEPLSPYIVKTNQQISSIAELLEKQDGNKQDDLVPAAGVQMRVAVFHDEKRQNDLIEVHDDSDDIYYVLKGSATLLLGGKLVDPNEISTGEWRSRTAVGGQQITVRKGDLVVVPRGTPHQRTVTGKGFSMILIKVFSVQQAGK